MKRRLRIFVILFLCGIAAYFWWQDWREHRFDLLIAAAAKRYQLDPALIKAVIWRETKFDPDARGRAGEIGLMQIRKTAAGEWAKAEHVPNFAHENCFDPAINTMAGSWYLKKVLKRYPQTDNPMAYALADYNAGRGNVLKWNRGRAATDSAAFIQQIDFPTTKNYVQAILHRRERYEKDFAARK